jgi:hypothetical protein
MVQIVGSNFDFSFGQLHDNMKYKVVSHQFLVCFKGKKI